MKFIKGMIFGSILGFASGMAVSEERRIELIRRVRTASRAAGGVSPSEPATPARAEQTPVAV
jgi:hypothetical protein